MSTPGSHTPTRSLLITMRIEYIIPLQMAFPVHRSRKGMAKPMLAKKKAESMYSCTSPTVFVNVSRNVTLPSAGTSFVVCMLSSGFGSFLIARFSSDGFRDNELRKQPARYAPSRI